MSNPALRGLRSISMPNVSVFDGLTKAEIAAIELEIENRNFKGYSELSEWCKSHGWQIERGALWTRGSKIQKRIQMLRDATDVATQIGKSVKDDEGALNDATLSIVQAGLFKLLNKMDDEAEAGEDQDLERQLDMLSKAAKATSEIGRASISVKKYKKEVQGRAELIANKVAETAKKGGLSADLVNSIKRDILGVAA